MLQQRYIVLVKQTIQLEGEAEKHPGKVSRSSQTVSIAPLQYLPIAPQNKKLEYFIFDFLEQVINNDFTLQFSK